MNENEIPNWIKIFSALLTPVLSIIATIILIYQYFLQKYRWKLDLFNKRYIIYNNTMEFISYIVQYRNINDNQIYQFLRKTKDRDFLFGKEIHKYLDELYKKSYDLNFVLKKIENTPIGEDRNKLVDQESILTDWFSKQFEHSRSIFSKYLSIDKK